MKIWIDLLTPKQALFFDALAQELLKKGHMIIFTSRKYRETVGIIENKLKKKYNIKILGKYGGRSLKNKLLSALDRSMHLSEYIHNEAPDLAISFTSPDAARVAFGLGIPHISVSDSPHAEAPSRLSIPLSEKLYSPWVIPKRKWIKYGIEKEKILQYKGLDPISWIRRHKEDWELINKYELDKNDYIVIRPIEYKASYQLNTNLTKMIRINKIVRKILDNSNDIYRVFIIPRYEEDVEKMRNDLKNLENKVIVLNEVVDALTLLNNSIGFIGYGGTMTMEAALIGKPSISTRPGKQPDCIKYLINLGMIKHVNSIKQCIKTLSELMSKKDEIERKAEEISISMEDPAKFIAETLLNR